MDDGIHPAKVCLDESTRSISCRDDLESADSAKPARLPVISLYTVLQPSRMQACDGYFTNLPCYQLRTPFSSAAACWV